MTVDALKDIITSSRTQADGELIIPVRETSDKFQIVALQSDSTTGKIFIQTRCAPDCDFEPVLDCRTGLPDFIDLSDKRSIILDGVWISDIRIVPSAVDATYQIRIHQGYL